MSAPHGNVPDIETIKSQAYRPKRAVITAGMPYANKPLHLGHLAGVHVPADIYAGRMIMARSVRSAPSKPESPCATLLMACIRNSARRLTDMPSASIRTPEPP